MDATAINALASNVVAVLAPYLAKAGEELAKQAGKAALDKIAVLYQAIRTRLKDQPAAAEALGDLEAAPDDEDARAALRHQLKKQLSADPGFTDTLRKMLDEIGQDKQAVTFLTQVYGGEVGQIFNVDKVDKLDARFTAHKEK